MMYLPLYRKYRPQSFADLVGQQAVVTTLGNAIALNRVAHAYLFCGPRGTGKTSTARIFAKSLNCEQGPTLTPCQTCPSCTSITQGTALDVIEFDAASNNGVDDARELIESCQFAPMAGRYKIYIIDEVHMLSKQAFNALLKTLEEPPPNVVFLFATTEAHQVLPTIISRCQRFDFRRITTDDIAERLGTIAQAEGFAVAPEALIAMARQARGGLRDAVGLLDQLSVMVADGETITEEWVARFTQGLGDDLLTRLLEAIAQQAASDALTVLNEMADRGVEPSQVLKALGEAFRNLLLAKVTGNLQDVTPAIVEAFAPEELTQILTRLSEMERQLRQSSQPQLWLEVGLMGLVYRKDIHTLSDLHARLQAVEARLGRGHALPAQGVPPQVQAVAVAAPAQSAPLPQALANRPPAAQPTASQPPPMAATSAPTPVVQPAQTDVLPNWEAIVARVDHSPTRAQLTQLVHLQSVEGNKVVLACASKPIMVSLQDPRRMGYIEKALSDTFQRPMTIEMVVKAKATQPPQPAGLATANQAPPLMPPPQSAATPTAEQAPAPAALPTPVPAETPTQTLFSPSSSTPPPSPASADPPAVIPTTTAPLANTPPPLASNPANPSPDWDEARQYAVDLLQGKVLD
jgi:DNA polymerase-3 subunit gamma/tau